jgi:uncharacterized protein (TIGR02145 family)
MNTKHHELMKKLSIISCLIVLASSAFNSCKKDDNSPESGNPYNGKTTAQFNPDIAYGTMTDQDGNVYKTITFGAKSVDGISQTWMAENLRTTKYNDGTDIPNVTDDVSWAGLTSGAYCSYKNTTRPDSIATFGLLYNFYTIDTEKIAPQGWHIPTDMEWKRLMSYHGSYSVCGGYMKEKGTSHWVEPNYLGNNTCGFTALPAGIRHYQDNFRLLGTTATWWTAESMLNYAYSYSVGSNGAEVYDNYTDKRFGYSIRLVKD